VRHEFLTPELGREVVTISRLVNAFFRWEFNSCETLVKDRDVPTYVEYGAADCGVAGRLNLSVPPEGSPPLANDTWGSLSAVRACWSEIVAALPGERQRNGDDQWCVCGECGEVLPSDFNTSVYQQSAAANSGRRPMSTDTSPGARRRFLQGVGADVGEPPPRPSLSERIGRRFDLAVHLR